MKLKIFAATFVFLLMGGCAVVTPTATLTKQQYETQLGSAVCLAIKDLNAQGALGDEKKLSAGLENSLQAAMVKLGFDIDAMLQAKAQYFTTEEHEKLLKLHLTWCLLNLSSEDATKSQS
jgi:hypothetical protein